MGGQAEGGAGGEQAEDGTHADLLVRALERRRERKLKR
jgi:hypothetical protein